MQNIDNDVEEYQPGHCGYYQNNGFDDGSFPDDDEIAEYARMIKAVPVVVVRG